MDGELYLQRSMKTIIPYSITGTRIGHARSCSSSIGASSCDMLYGIHVEAGMEIA